MLLLFLTLVLLGGSANGAQKPQSQSLMGKTEEPYSFVFSKEGEEINGVRLQVGPSGYLTSIQVRYGTTWTSRQGSPEGPLKEVSLKPDESIVQVTGSNDQTKCLQELNFVTDQGGKLEFGKLSLNQFNASPTMEGKVLSSIFGRYEPPCLTGLVFHWIPKKEPKNIKLEPPKAGFSKKG